MRRLVLASLVLVSGVTASIAFAAARTADIEVRSPEGPKSVAPGKTGTFSVSVRNNGPSGTVAKDFHVTLINLSWFDLVSITTSNGTCTITTAGQCEIGALPSGSSAKVTAVLKATGPTGATDSFDFVAQGGSADVAEPNPPGETNNRYVFTDILIGGSSFQFKGKAAKKQSLSSLKVKLTCTEKCTFSVRAKAKGGGKSATSKKVKGSLGADKSKTVKLKFSSSALKKLKGKHGTVAIDADAVGPGGKKRGFTLKVKFPK